MFLVDLRAALRPLGQKRAANVAVLNSTPRSSKGQQLSQAQHYETRGRASESQCMALRRSAIEPYRHAGLEFGRIALRIEAQP